LVFVEYALEHGLQFCESIASTVSSIDYDSCSKKLLFGFSFGLILAKSARQ